MSDRQNTRVAAYYFPGFHEDSTTGGWHGKGWTEWDVLRAARPRYAGHRQPRTSAWGEFDEADPAWALRQASLAKSAGIDAFLVDWYWYGGADFLNRPLDEGMLPWGSEFPVDFALMWANHSWQNIHPASAILPSPDLLPGRTDGPGFAALVDTVIERYLSHPRYLHVNGRPYFSIYEPRTFIDGMGSISKAARGLDVFRERVRSAGLGDLHLNVIAADRAVLSNEQPLADVASAVRDLGADSVTSYVWIHHYDPAAEGFPVGSYSAAATVNAELWQRMRADLTVPYYPNVTVGWDSSPRTIQTDRYENRGYPWMSVLDSAPAEFGAALRSAVEFAAASSHSGTGLVTINAWNEWTEGSYLLPDTDHGTAMLEQCAAVLGSGPLNLGGESTSQLRGEPISPTVHARGSIREPPARV